MGLTCGIVGVPSCGKTAIFNAITASRALSFDGSEKNEAVVSVPDSRLDRLVEMYHPRKVTPATLEVVDIPGLRGGVQGNGRSSRLLAHIKDVDALLHVVRCFEDGAVPFEYETVDPVRDVEMIDLELMVADMTTLENKITRLAKKVRSGDKDAVRENSDCEKVLAAMQQGVPARKQGLTPSEVNSVRECNLVSLKPVVYVANVKTREDSGNRHVQALAGLARAEGAEIIMVCGKDEAEIAQLDRADQAEFLREMGLEESSMQRLLHAANRGLGLVNFFTTGEDEVRAWTCHKGDKAPVAAGKIHTDMEKGFIRMEVTRYEDLVELGSEAAVSPAGKLRVQSRDYEVQDGDIVTVLFNRGKGR
jgi:hypothetical protein